MIKEYLKTLTPEQRALQRQQALITIENKKAWARDNLRDDYKDKQHWATLASKYKVRLPNYYEPATNLKYVKRAMRKVGVTPKEYSDALGFKYSEIGVLNKDMPAYADVGLFLEWFDGENVNMGVTSESNTLQDTGVGCG